MRSSRRGRFAGSRGLFEQRETHGCPLSEVGFRNTFGEPADSANEACALRHTNGAARIEHVELMGCLADEIVGREDPMKVLVLPAYDFVCKAAHQFNVLDARGAIGVTERARFIGRVRGLAKGVAEAYLAQRTAMGFPLLEKAAAHT